MRVLFGLFLFALWAVVWFACALFLGRRVFVVALLFGLRLGSYFVCCFGVAFAVAFCVCVWGWFSIRGCVMIGVAVCRVWLFGWL